MKSKKVKIVNNKGISLAGRMEFPISTKPDAFAIFAHVFTGNKSLNATRNISRALTQNGIAVLRFDFTGLGDSEGDFSDTNFSSNVDDIKAAAEYLSEHFEAPSILVGHSLGGAAAIFAANEIDSIIAVATVGTPSKPEHVTHLFGTSVDVIEKEGSADVSIGGRDFTIKKQFLDDLKQKDMGAILSGMRKAILIMHSPQDTIVGIENAAKIYTKAFHPKSFVTLNNADHMLSKKDDAFYAGTVISSWLKRYVPSPVPEEKLSTTKQVVVRLGKEGFTTEIRAGNHSLLADESEQLGGDDFGPSPYELLNASLGSCTAMTLHMYARRKKWPLKEVRVHLAYDRVYNDDCNDCEDINKYINHFDVCLELEGDLSEEQKTRLLEIAQKCPVHKTLKRASEFTTKILV